MGSFSNYLELKILDHITGKAAYSMPTVYVALSTADPLDTGLGIAEPVGNNYARKATSASDWNSAASGSISNSSDIAFNEASGDWGEITHFALFDNLTSGNMLAHGELTVHKTVLSGDTPKFSGGAPGALVINLD